MSDWRQRKGKTPVFEARNVQQNQAQGWVAISWGMMKGKKRAKKDRTKNPPQIMGVIEES